MGRTSMLELRQVDVHRGDVRVLWSVSLRVEDGTIVALLGPNAAGKTTLLMTISGLIKHSKGAVFFEGNRIDGQPVHRIVETRCEHGPRRKAVVSRDDCF